MRWEDVPRRTGMSLINPDDESEADRRKRSKQSRGLDDPWIRVDLEAEDRVYKQIKAERAAAAERRKANDEQA